MSRLLSGYSVGNSYLFSEVVAMAMVVMGVLCRRDCATKDSVSIGVPDVTLYDVTRFNRTFATTTVSSAKIYVIAILFNLVVRVPNISPSLFRFLLQPNLQPALVKLRVCSNFTDTLHSTPRIQV